MTVVLTTERLRLRPLDTGDVDALHAVCMDPDVRRYLWDDLPVTIETVAEVVAQSGKDRVEKGLGLWGLRRTGERELIGVCGLRNVPGTELVEILYSLDRAQWGQGLATEAARAVLDWGFDVLGLERIHGGFDEPNLGSRRVLERLGMRYVGHFEVNGMQTPYYALDRASRSP